MYMSLMLLFACWNSCKRALIVHPRCPAAVRLGIGLCRYKLGQFDKARQAFTRVLQACSIFDIQIDFIIVDRTCCKISLILSSIYVS